MNFVVVQSLSCVQQHSRLPCPSLSPGVCSNSCPLSWQCHPTISPLSSPSPPAFSLSQYQVFSSEPALQIRWPNYWSFSFSISPSNEYSRLISFEIGWFDLLAIQETFRSLLQPLNHSSKASILWCSAFSFALSQPYVTTVKTTVLTIWIFVVRVSE